MTQSPAPTQTASGSTSRVRFLVLGWLCVAAAAAYITRNASAVAESTIRAALGLSKEQSGFLLSAFFFSYALCQIPGAQLAEKRGPRFVLPLFAVVWSLATLLNGCVTTFGQAIAARMIQGIAQAGLFPAAMLAVSRWFPKTGRAFASGALGSAMSVGGAVCAWLTGVLLESLTGSVPAGWNWRVVFFMFALPGFGWAFVFWKWFTDRPREHKSVNAAELDLIESGQSQQTNSLKAKLPTPWMELLTSPALWCICGQQVFRAAGYMFFTSWFATYLQETRGVGIAKSGFLNMLPLLGVVAGGLVGGAVSDWVLKLTGRRDFARRWMSIICLLACSASVFAVFAVDNTFAAVLVMTLGSFLAALAAPSGYSITIDMGGPHVATVNATMNMMGNLGAWAFPVAVPILLAQFGSWDAVVLVFGSLFVGAAICWVLLKPEGLVVEQSLLRRTRRNQPPIGVVASAVPRQD